MRKESWPTGALAIVALGIVVLAMPAGVEGPVLIPISPGHALSVLDVLGVIPLVVGSLLLYQGLWRRRERLHQVARDAPATAWTAVFAAGFGLGLLIASAFSAFWWWWAIGAVLFGTVFVVAVVATARR